MSDAVLGKSILVTGAAGFIGAHLVARLHALGARVHAFVADGQRATRLCSLGVAGQMRVLDLTDDMAVGQALSRSRPDVVYHLAAERDERALINNPGQSASIGAGLLKACAAYDLDRFVTIGSSLEVADPVTGGAVGAHGVAKAKAMAAMQRTAAQLGVPFSAFRTHYVYGPLHGKTKLIPSAIRAVAEGRTIPLTQAQIRKRFVYVADIVEACIHVLTLPASTQQVFWATATQQLSNEDVVTRIGQLMGRPVVIEADAFAARDWDREGWSLSTAAMLPGWAARCTLENGLRACIAEAMTRAAD